MASHRLTLALAAALTLTSCGHRVVELPKCWAPGDLKRSSSFHGTVLIFAGYDTLPMMVSLACDGSVIAELPEGFTLPLPPGPEFSAPIEDLFWEATVTGKVGGVVKGRPSVQLFRIINPRRAKPSWLKSR